MPRELVYPIRLEDPPITGVQADGERTYFSDLLRVGDLVDPSKVEGGEAIYTDGRVVRRDDGSLWVEAIERPGAVDRDQ